jgi:hypothetical protein
MLSWSRASMVWRVKDIDGLQIRNVTANILNKQWSLSRTGCFIPGDRAPGAYYRGIWLGIKADLKDAEKTKFLTLPVLEFRPSVKQPVASCYND